MRRLILAAALGAATFGALSQGLPRDIAGLRDDRVEPAQRELRDRGYRRAYSDEWRDRTWQYWWNRRDHLCLLVVIRRDRVDRVEESSETDCVADGGERGRLSAPGRAAVEAMQLLGGGTLRHHSHERDRRRFDSPREIAAFERGYRDGLAGARGNSRDDAYREGLQIALERRGGTAGGGGVGSGSGGRPPVGRLPDDAPISALVGTPEALLASHMAARGYELYAKSGKRDTVQSVWVRRASRECVVVVSSRGSVYSVGDGNEATCR